MNIILTESFKNYQVKNKITSITVNAASSGGSCCRIVVPKVKAGEPKGSLENYTVFESQGITFYISKNLEVKETITFSHETLFGQEMLEMKGFEIRHYANS